MSRREHDHVPAGTQMASSLGQLAAVISDVLENIDIKNRVEAFPLAQEFQRADLDAAAAGQLAVADRSGDLVRQRPVGLQANPSGGLAITEHPCRIAVARTDLEHVAAEIRANPLPQVRLPMPGRRENLELRSLVNVRHRDYPSETRTTLAGSGTGKGAIDRALPSSVHSDPMKYE